jgi:23S rRNA (pseudouridine1915-N3)-methyltransferase
MKIKLVKIGKPSRREIIALVADYEKRLRPLNRIEFIEYKDIPPESRGVKNGKKDPTAIIRELKKSSGDIVVALDERGKSWSSVDLANFIDAKIQNREVKSLAFVVGGPYGLGDEARQAADVIWSLSQSVFPSEIAWLLLVEQIYRAFSIIQGTSYHHE